MIEQFQHKLTNSFMLWFDNFLMTKGEAYHSVSGELFPTTDDRIDSDYNVYASSFKEWVFDDQIGGVVTGVQDASGNVYGRNDGIVIDYYNGRVLSTSELTSPVTPLPSTYSTKEVNVYFTNDTEEDLIVDRKYEYNHNATGAINPYDQVVPAVFFSVNSTDNDPLAFGGEQTTKVTINTTVLAENPYQLDGILSIFADSQDEIFNQIPMAAHPLNENGDLKSGIAYTYTGLASDYGGKPFFIDSVQSSKLTSKAQRELAGDLYVGFIDFDIHTHRFRFS